MLDLLRAVWPFKRYEPTEADRLWHKAEAKRHGYINPELVYFSCDSPYVWRRWNGQWEYRYYEPTEDERLDVQW
jgi:hypothetical protein